MLLPCLLLRLRWGCGRSALPLLRKRRRPAGPQGWRARRAGRRRRAAARLAAAGGPGGGCQQLFQLLDVHLHLAHATREVGGAAARAGGCGGSVTCRLPGGRRRSRRRRRRRRACWRGSGGCVHHAKEAVREFRMRGAHAVSRIKGDVACKRGASGPPERRKCEGGWRTLIHLHASNPDEHGREGSPAACHAGGQGGCLAHSQAHLRPVATAQSARQWCAPLPTPPRPSTSHRSGTPVTGAGRDTGQSAGGGCAGVPPARRKLRLKAAPCRGRELGWMGAAAMQTPTSTGCPGCKLAGFVGGFSGSLAGRTRGSTQRPSSAHVGPHIGRKVACMQASSTGCSSRRATGQPGRAQTANPDSRAGLRGCRYVNAGRAQTATRTCGVPELDPFARVGSCGRGQGGKVGMQCPLSFDSRQCHAPKTLSRLAGGMPQEKDTEGAKSAHRAGCACISSGPMVPHSMPTEAQAASPHTRTTRRSQTKHKR